jgi:hypothetical protein
MPQRKVRSPSRIGSFFRRKEPRQLRHTQAVLRNRFRVTHTGMPPASATYPFQYTKFIAESGDANGGVSHSFSLSIGDAHSESQPGKLIPHGRAKSVTRPNQVQRSCDD